MPEENETPEVREKFDQLVAHLKWFYERGVTVTVTPTKKGTFTMILADASKTLQAETKP